MKWPVVVLQPVVAPALLSAVDLTEMVNHFRVDEGSDVEFVFYFGNSDRRTKWLHAGNSENSVIQLYSYREG